MLLEDYPHSSSLRDSGLKKLTNPQVEQIDELLESLGEHGEIHLVVQRGVLKYINRVEKNQFWNANEQDQNDD
jgi:hypothetical protein